MRGVDIQDEFTADILKEYGKYFATEIKFNENLIAKDFLLSPMQILPLTGLARYGGKKQSIIVAHTKQMMLTIPKQKDQFPHLILSTGTVCIPVYKNNRQGQIAKEDHCFGGVITEIKNNKIFFIRTIRFDNKGFQDLNIYYSNKVEIKNINSVICEPQIGIEDSKAVKICNDIVKNYKPKNIFIHDSFDAGSVNPHIKNKIGIRCKNLESQFTLEKELKYFGDFLMKWELEFPKIKWYHVASNHNYFVDRYLEEGEFIKMLIMLK
jgi:hypothetical protein